MSNVARRTPPVLLVALAVVALGSLVGCAPAVPTGAPAPGSASSAPAGPSAPGSGSSERGTSCAEFTVASFAKVVNVPIGTPFVAAAEGPNSIACWYGIGKNATVSGSTVETLGDDNILITTIGIDAPHQFSEDTGKDLNAGAVVALNGVGDKAAYNVSALSGNVPQLYELKGTVYCHVQLVATSDQLVDSTAAAIATDEAALCQDAFSAAG